jgi:hypothetical protein
MQPGKLHKPFSAVKAADISCIYADFVADGIFRFRLRVEIGGCTGVETVRISGGDVVFVKDATI